METRKIYKTCIWGHSLDDAKIYGGVRYCAKCKSQRGKFEWWKSELNRIGKPEQIISWRTWMRDETGGPFTREFL